jgi:hypothetical protein
MHYLNGPQFSFFEIKNHSINVYYENVFTFDFQLSNLSLMIGQFFQINVLNNHEIWIFHNFDD